jgi:hypothetical protein
MEYALLLTNCTPCPQQLPASLGTIEVENRITAVFHFNRTEAYFFVPEH